MKTHDELIAEFMGHKLKEGYVIPKTIFTSGWSATPIDYRSSWDYLMEVVKEIDKLQLFHSEEYQELASLGIFANKDTIYLHIIPVIEWYNSQNQQP